VMGTAVRSGANRAIEAAQAAMASPLLEEGAIDGARGILINITGSSSLKLSEVNEASSLIQTSAHEDANIIFGAVLDEKMGEEVKITVIATGFRDQMPARRARMLDVEAIPVVSVPVVAPGHWMKEADSDSHSAPLRFLSEVEDEEPELQPRAGSAETVFEPVLVSEAVHEPVAVQSVVAEVVTVQDAPVHQTNPLQEFVHEFSGRFVHESEGVGAPARPRFAELSEAPTYAPLPRDYATELHPHSGVPSGEAVRTPHAAPAPFAQATEPDHTDLDIPAFLRRGQF
jgi:cell division protein FtsZ